MILAGNKNLNTKLLRSYEEAEVRRRGAGEQMFQTVFVACLIATIGVGLLLATLDLPPLVFGQIAERKATFLIEQPEPIDIQPEQTPPPEVEDLTEMPELGHEETVAAIEPPVVEEAAPPEPETKPEPRRVYGVRRVFAKGLGQGGAGGSGIISKRGNTLDKEPDDLVATEADLEGQLAPLSSVTSAPVLKSRVKPEYTSEMIENRVEGIVRARLLVDVDGAVKDIEILEDIGFGSRQAASEAFGKLRFEPAQRGDQPVAVWIIMKYRFAFQD